jgi:hypothetical protein
LPTRANRPIARTLSAAAVGLACVVASPAGATKPAVRAVNGQIVGGYAYDHAGAATISEQGSSVYVPTREEKDWDVGGILTVPVVHWLGARVNVTGGMADIENLAGGGFAGSDAQATRVEAGADLFVRNPDVGFFGLGYRFGWEDPPEAGDRLLVNSLVVEPGFYIPDQGLGAVDWTVTFVYSRGKLSGAGATDEFNAYRLDATSGWYLTESFRFTAGFRFELEDPELALPGRELRGTGELAWLLPGFGERRYVTAIFNASGGRARDDLAPPFSYADRPVWAVGGGLSFSYPGATSLLELTRELH